MQLDYFQNVTLAAVEPKERVAPTEEDIITQGLSGIGGCCINLNFFVKILFQALGLEAYAIKGTHNFAPVEGTHCMVVVKLKDGNVYMVEGMLLFFVIIILLSIFIFNI